MTTFRIAHQFGSWLTVGIMSACAAIHRPPATVASLTMDASDARAAERATTDTIIATLARRAVRRGDLQLDILLLSGGGQHGAYGAGFLRGWKQRSDTPMPAFDLVTGISTGGLQAPFALLGTPEALDTLSALYRDAVDRTAPKLNLWFWLRKTGGVVKTDGLEATLRQVFDSQMVHALQREFSNGRQLVVGTTDLDLGIAKTWDMRKVLDSASGLTRARSLLRATSAIPGIFPPVILDGHVHSDGGTISNIMPVLGLEEYRRLATALRRAGAAEPVTLRVWVIMNLWLDPTPVVMDPANRGRLSQRSNLLLYFAQQPLLVRRLAELAHAVNGDVPGLRMELRVTAVPSAIAKEPGATELMNKPFMLRLEQLAFERARSSSPWDVVAVPSRAVNRE